MSGDENNKYTIIECSDDTEESLSFLLKKYVLDIPKSIKSDNELTAYDNIRFPSQIHDSEEYEYEPFE